MRTYIIQSVNGTLDPAATLKKVAFLLNLKRFAVWNWAVSGTIFDITNLALMELKKMEVFKRFQHSVSTRFSLCCKAPILSSFGNGRIALHVSVSQMVWTTVNWTAVE
jgi:hypothetical protein